MAAVLAVILVELSQQARFLAAPACCLGAQGAGGLLHEMVFAFWRQKKDQVLLGQLDY